MSEINNTSRQQNDTSRVRGYRPFTRKLIQLYSALLYNAHLKGFIEGEIYQGKTKAVCVPGFNCYSCPGAVGACPLGSIQNAFASAGHRAGWYVIGIILLYGVIFGRTICGWLCPLGLIQELLHKIPTPKIVKSAVTRALSWLKYVILGLFVIAIPLWYGLSHDMPLPAFCKYICPAGTFEGAMGLLPAKPARLGMLGILFTRKFIIMLVIFLACIFIYRSFCRFLCPLGAIYGLFNRFNIIGVKVDKNRCNHCGACVRHCQMDIRHVGDHECINCGKCMEHCARGAISIKAGKFTLMGPQTGTDDPQQRNAAYAGLDNQLQASSGEGASARNVSSGKKRRTAGRGVIRGIALAVLGFALLWYNVLDPSVRGKNAVGDKAISTEAAGEDPKGSAGKEEAAALKETEPEEADTEAATGTAAEADTAADTEAAADAAEKADAGVSEEADEKIKADSDTEADAGTKTDTDKETDAETYVSDAPYGHEVGQQLEDFTAECFDGGTFHLADTRGKITFINLWATYCAPCIQELPYFNDLYKKHEGDVAVLAVHTSLVVKDDPAEFISDKGYTMPFTTDGKDNTIFGIVGGSSTLPQTIVLNRRGEVIYNKTKSMTPEMLEALYEKADES